MAFATLPDSNQAPNKCVSTHDVALSAEFLQDYSDWFGFPCEIWDLDSSSKVLSIPGVDLGSNLFGDQFSSTDFAAKTPVQFLAETDSISVFSTSLKELLNRNWIAIGCVLTDGNFDSPISIETSSLLGLEPTKFKSWAADQTVWSHRAIEKMAQGFFNNQRASLQSIRQEEELDSLSNNLASTYEEISLLYRVTQNLRISRSDEDLGGLVLEWIAECLPAKSCAVQFLPVENSDEATYSARGDRLLLQVGEKVIDEASFNSLVCSLEMTPGCGPFVANKNHTFERTNFELPQNIKQIVIAPLAEGRNLIGYLAVFNHVDGEEFGTIEANLLASVGAILGIHCGNYELYRQQSEFLASVVRGLTSAIDAKDPYTCGHSDRVARISVRLCRELGKNHDTLHTMYMAGLLHDIGKIGIEDHVLCKPDRLTKEEYEHIKLHPEFGYNILADIKPFAPVLPVVLHHHEQWDGKGYPHQLAGEDIPELARICAVADAFDAMTSDRCYRKGMAYETVFKIFKEGADAQWDPKVVDAFFACKEDILDLCKNERENLSLDLHQWT